MKDTNTWGFETKQLHIGQEKAEQANSARAVPIYQTTSYVFDNCAQAAARYDLSDSGYIYGRLGNPTQAVLEKRMAALEGGIAALAVASGASAISYVFQSLAHTGDHIVAEKTLYGGTYNLLANILPQYGITTTFVDPEEKDGFAKAIRPNTKAVYIETMGNPNSNLVDIEQLAKVAHDSKIPLLVDSTFTPPCLLRPIEYGADIVIHSATKFIGGHGTTLGGIIVDGGNFDWEASGKFPAITEPSPSYHGLSFTKAAGRAAFITRLQAVFLRDMGAAISPFNAFLLLQGLETLSLRVERQTENALKVVEYLSSHPKIEKVSHPSIPGNSSYSLYQKYFPKGAGSIFTVDIKGGEEAAMNFVDRLQLFSLLANVADMKSLVIHPGSTTHALLNEEELAEHGIGKNTVRLSIGAECIKDIISDLEQALL